MLAICAGYQLLGEYFPDATSTPAPGLEIIDIRTDRLPERAVGELAADPLVAGLPRLTGYENHGGATHLGADVQPLATVRAGVGNGDGTEGAISGHVVGTYLHGPGLARNPALADLLLGWCAAACWSRSRRPRWSSCARSGCAPLWARTGTDSRSRWSRVSW